MGYGKLAIIEEIQRYRYETISRHKVACIALAPFHLHIKQSHFPVCVTQESVAVLGGARGAMVPGPALFVTQKGPRV